jgi:hypothetical protein
MKTTLIIDEKVTLWRRNEVVVNTAELEKATAEGKLEEFIELSSFNYKNSELLLETEGVLTPEDNDGQPTIEAFLGDSLETTIYTNAK